jgi:hypothetical protein
MHGGSRHVFSLGDVHRAMYSQCEKLRLVARDSHISPNSTCFSNSCVLIGSLKHWKTVFVSKHHDINMYKKDRGKTLAHFNPVHSMEMSVAYTTII